MKAQKHSRHPWGEWDESKMGLFIGSPCGLHCQFQLKFEIAHWFRRNGWGAAIGGSVDRCIGHNVYI